MTTHDLRPLHQASHVTYQHASQAVLPMASRLAKLARDQFWAARRAVDRPAMVHWSVRENALRRRAHGLTAIGAVPARIRARA